MQTLRTLLELARIGQNPKHVMEFAFLAGLALILGISFIRLLLRQGQKAKVLGAVGTILFAVLFMGATSQVVGVLNNIRFANQFPTLQLAITDVCNLGGGEVIIPPNFTSVLSNGVTTGEYGLLAGCSNLTVQGADKATSIVQVASGTQRSNANFDIFFFNNNGASILHDFVARGFTLDFNGANNLIPNGSPNKRNAFLFANYGRDITLEDMIFLNNPGQQTFSCGANTSPQTCQRIHIRNNFFHNAAGGVAGNTFATDHSCVYVQADDSEVVGNTAINDSYPSPNVGTAYEIHARHSRIANNTAVNWEQGMNLVATVTDFRDNLVQGNVLYNVQTGFNLWTASTFVFDDWQIKNNSIVLNAGSNTGCVYGVANLAGSVAPSNGEIIGNSCNQLGTLTGTSLLTAGVGLAKCNTTSIKQNRIWNLAGRGIDLTCGDNSTIDANEIYDTGQGGAAGPYTQGVAVQTVSTITNVSINNNHIFNVNAANYIATGVLLFGTVNTPYFINNRVDVSTEVNLSGWTGSAGYFVSPKLNYFTNNANALFRENIFCGKSADQICEWALSDKGVTLKWALRKNADNSFSIWDYAANLNSFTCTTGSSCAINSGSSGAVTINQATNSGTFGLQVYSGGASPAVVFNVNGSGLAVANGGIKAGASGTTVSDSRNLAQYPATLTTSAAVSDNVSITGVTSSSKCSLTPTNASAATNVATTYVSAKTTNQITVTHTATASMTYDILCSAQ